MSFSVDRGDGDKSEPVAARAELADLGIAHTVAAFSNAAARGNLEVVKLFVGAGMDVNATDNDGGTVLHWAAGGGSLEVVKYLVGEGADVTVAAFIAAAERGHLEVVKVFVGAGMDVNAKGNVGGFTALHMAAFHGHLSVVKYLVEQGAEVNVQDNADDTAKDLASQTDVVEYLESVGG